MWRRRSFCRRLTATDQLARFGVPSRKGLLRTIAAMHHQINQVVVTSLVCRTLAGKCSGNDAIEIKYPKALGVRNDPNLESIPKWHRTPKLVGTPVSRHR